MDSDTRGNVELRLLTMTLFFAAVDRRDQEINLVFDSAKPADAQERMAPIFQLDSELWRAVLDRQVFRMTLRSGTESPAWAR